MLGTFRERRRDATAILVVIVSLALAIVACYVGAYWRCKHRRCPDGYVSEFSYISADCYCVLDL